MSAEDMFLTDSEVSTLNVARTLLAEIQKRCGRRGFIQQETGDGQRYYFGRVAERAEEAEHAIFQFLNGSNSYGLLKLSESQVHNRNVA